MDECSIAVMIPTELYWLWTASSTTRTVTVQEYMKVLRNYDGMSVMAWEELCYGKAERLRDAGNKMRWWRDSLLR